MSRSKLVTLVAVAVAILGSQPARGQSVTTGAISGVVSDQSGAVLPGAGVVAVHGPTGTVYSTTASHDGSFALLNLRVGGPYQVTATLAGFKEQKKSRHQRAARAKRAGIDFKLEVAGDERSRSRSSATPRSSTPRRTGPASNVQQETIENLPTVGRGVEDFARLNPYFASTAIGGTNSNALSVAGRNNRYNNIQIDGAVNNDLFGLARQRARRAARRTRSRSASTPSRRSSSWSRPTTCARAASREAASTPSPGAARTSSPAPPTGSRATRASWATDPSTGPFGKFNDKQLRGQPGRTDREGQGLLLRERRAAAAARCRTASRSAAARVRTSAMQAEAQRFSDILADQVRLRSRRPSTRSSPRDTDNDKVFVRLDFNLSPEPPADPAAQLHRRAPTTTSARSSSRRSSACPNTSYQFNEQDQLDGGPAQQHLRHRGQRAARRPTSASATIRDGPHATSPRCRSSCPTGPRLRGRDRAVLRGQRPQPGQSSS